MNKKEAIYSALICDDDQDQREVFQTILESLGVFRSVIVAKDGMEALHKIDNQKFDLVIFDQNMPTKNGIDCVRHLVNGSIIDPATIILCTGQVDLELIKKAQSYRCDKILTKPFDNTKFMNYLKTILKYHRDKKTRKVL